MHEMSIAQNIIELVSDKARSENAGRVSRIELAVGTLSGVMVDALRFGFEIVTKNSIAEGAELVIEEIQGEARCQDCNITFPAESYIVRCPKCDGYVVDMICGQELKLKSIIID